MRWLDYLFVYYDNLIYYNKFITLMMMIIILNHISEMLILCKNMKFTRDYMKSPNSCNNAYMNKLKLWIRKMSNTVKMTVWNGY
jgi:hypothetical protein